MEPAGEYSADMSLLLLANAPLLIGVAAGLGLGICVLLFWRQAKTVDSLQKSVQRLQRSQKDAHADVRSRLETSTEAQRSLQGRLQALGQSDARIAEVASLVQALDAEVRGLAGRVEQAEASGAGAGAVLTSLRADAQTLTERIERAETGIAAVEQAQVQPPRPPQTETKAVHATRAMDTGASPAAAGGTAASSTPLAPSPDVGVAPAPRAHPGDGRAAIAPEEEEPSGTWIYVMLFVLVGVAMLAQCAQMGS